MRVLIAEDERIAARQLEAVLTAYGYEVIIARDGLAAWNILQDTNAPKLAILDWMMPGLDGVELCRRVRQSRMEPYTYILLLTERTGRQDLIIGMNAGADDYVAKPFDAKELEVRLRAGRRVLSLMDEVIVARDSLRHDATHDSVTGLFNHSAIRESLNRELERAMREESSLGVMMVDLDHFKRVNDTHGHVAGDAVLAEIGRRMCRHIRSYDSGRDGGEEFLIVLPSCDAQAMSSKAEAVREGIGGRAVDTWGEPIGVTASIGAAVYPGSGTVSTDELIRAADAALYRAKKSGRNRVEVAASLYGTGDLKADFLPADLTALPLICQQ